MDRSGSSFGQTRLGLSEGRGGQRDGERVGGWEERRGKEEEGKGGRRRLK